MLRNILAKNSGSRGKKQNEAECVETAREKYVSEITPVNDRNAERTKLPMAETLWHDQHGPQTGIIE